MPAAEPQALLAELGEVATRLEGLIVAINRTNGQAALSDGRTLAAPCYDARGGER